MYVKRKYKRPKIAGIKSTPIFLEEIKSSLRIMGSDTEDDPYFDVFFPSFTMVTREISVEITERANNPITSDQYL